MNKIQNIFIKIIIFIQVIFFAPVEFVASYLDVSNIFFTLENTTKKFYLYIAELINFILFCFKLYGLNFFHIYKTTSSLDIKNYIVVYINFTCFFVIILFCYAFLSLFLS